MYSARVLLCQHLCRTHGALNLIPSSSFVQCLGSKSLRQIKDEEGFTLYLCLCCVWLSLLFFPGRLQAGIKARAALNMDLYCSTHTLRLSWRYYHTYTHTRPSFFLTLGKYTRQNAQRTAYTEYWRQASFPLSPGTAKLLFPITLQLVSSKKLAFTPSGNIPGFSNVSPLSPACKVS